MRFDKSQKIGILKMSRLAREVVLFASLNQMLGAKCPTLMANGLPASLDN